MNDNAVDARRVSPYASFHFERYYGYSPADYRLWARKFAYHFRELLPSNRSARILDLGCGGGHFLYFLHSLGYSNLAGVDADSKQAEVARGMVACDVEQADIIRFLRSCPGGYDLVSCHHVIEHLSLDDAAELLRLVYGALAPGGRFVLSTPNGARPWVGWHLFADLSHDHLYTSSSLKEVMELAGFLDVSLRAGGPVPHDVPSSLRWVLWKTWREPYLKFTFAVENGLGCLKGAKLVVSPDLIAMGLKPQ